MESGKIIVVANQKGGVAKTSTVRNLSYALAEMGKKVLVVDFDPQYNLTTSFGVLPTQAPYNTGTLITNLLLDESLPDTNEFIQKIGSVDLIPSSRSLTVAEANLLMTPDSNDYLAALLNPLRLSYDYIIVDTNPSLGSLTINALTAADEVIIPIDPELFALTGLQALVDTIKKIKRKLNPSIEIGGILFTKCNKRTNLYEMLAGHNRQNAAAIANRELPCIVKENLSDEDAWIYVIETNVLQRSFSEMLPSEKAAVLALRYSKMICQGRRNDIVEELKRLENPDEIRENGTCGSDFHKSKSREALGAEYNLTGRSVATYLRINELSDALKIRIDNGEFSIAAAVQLSYLTEQEQQMVDDVLSGSEYKVNEGKVVLLREYTGKLTPERTEQILSGEFNRKPKKSTATAFKVKPAIYKKYFTASISQKEFDSIVDEALALYFAQKGQESEQEAG